MFTINIYLRFALIAAGFLLGIGLWAAWGFWYGFPFLLVGIFMLAGYLMFGTVMSAFQMIQQMDIAGAEKRLDLTFFPRILMFMIRSQFYMAKSTIAMQRKDFATAEGWTNKALATGFSSDNEKGIALLQLAGICAHRNQRNLAQNHLNEIKKLNITEKMVTEQVKEFEKQLKQLQAANNPANAFMMMGRGGFRPGGKRPRPKQH